ncbi:MAG: T9SS type A sorting domain-containing protein, partial [Rhodothermia bacterium]|nr:T9SS type A sorting domain-containing protein [Rhodothermia bacterium]
SWTALSVSIAETPAPSLVDRLEPAYPNPFSASTTVTYYLASSQDVRMRVYDLLGREVSTLVAAPQVAGPHRIEFDAASLSNGLYVVRLETPAGVSSETVALIR